VSIEQTAYEIGLQRNVAFSFTKGSNITAQLTLNGLSRTVQVDEQQKRIVSEAISVPTATQMTYLLTLSNPLGSVDTSGAVNFMEPITGETRPDSLLIEQVAYEVGSQRNIAFNFSQGSNITGQLILDGQPWVVQVDESQKRVVSQTISVLTPSQMTYMLTLSNLLGSENISGLVDFMESISGIIIFF
ncbi:hypothetical protein PHET_01929, partial [Paragonimus heterotremus]